MTIQLIVKPQLCEFLGTKEKRYVQYTGMRNDIGRHVHEIGGAPKGGSTYWMAFDWLGQQQIAKNFFAIFCKFALLCFAERERRLEQ